MSPTSVRLQTVLYRTDLISLERHLLAATRAAAYACGRDDDLDVTIGLGCADDSSYAAAAEIADAQRIPCRVVHFDHNVGHGQGHNAIRRALGGADHLVVQNPDGQLAYDALWELLTHLRQDDTLGLVEARQVPFDHPKAYDGEGRIVWASGACFLVRGDAWDAVGGFDELFFLHGDDVDLSIRLRLAGYGIRYVPSARFFHAKSVDLTTGRIAGNAAESHFGRLGAMLVAWRYDRRALRSMLADLRASGDPESLSVLQAFGRATEGVGLPYARVDPAVLPIRGWVFGRHRY